MQNIKLNDIFNNLNKISDDKVNIDKALIEKTSLDITSSIDRVHGGLSGAPKFPHINNLFLLTCGTSESNDLVKLTWIGCPIPEYMIIWMVFLGIQ